MKTISKAQIKAQGLTPVVDALTEAGIAHTVGGTGGNCLAVILTVGNREMLITDAETFAGLPGYFVTTFTDTEYDDGNDATGESLAEVVRVAGEFAGRAVMA